MNLGSRIAATMLAPIEAGPLLFIITSAFLFFWCWVLLVIFRIQAMTVPLEWLSVVWGFLFRFPEGWAAAWGLLAIGVIAGKMRQELLKH